ncbi:MAG: hypothetical protein SF162_01450 [bacterium]|nr:hypothetical protein [bacterium]
MTNAQLSSRPPRWLHWTGKLGCWALIALLISIMLFVLSWPLVESYFEPYPQIDTRFAAGYSEAAFDQIQMGDSKARVQALVGEPLTDCLGFASDDYNWQYTCDGAFGLFDFAWLHRAVWFNAQGEVWQIVERVHYD